MGIDFLFETHEMPGSGKVGEQSVEGKRHVAKRVRLKVRSFGNRIASDTITGLPSYEN